MNDPDEMARLHSAGATVRHSSPFNDLPAHKNETELSDGFIRKWAVPFYMKIGSYGDKKWIEEIKEIKNEITPDICLSLLGDLNWRTRRVGAYFAAVKGYEDLIDIIGIHLLKSEVCCVGHIYAVTLAFFNTGKSVEFFNKYLDYYLTTPALYFDQKQVMEAILYLDKINNTDNFKRHSDNWRILGEKREPIEKQSALTVAKILEEQQGKGAAAEYLHSLSANTGKKAEKFTTEYFDEQVLILRDLNQYGR